MEQDYIQTNKLTWNQRTEFHIASEFYNQAKFIEGKNTLKEIELSLLNDVRGKSILHLQCHFGQDSLSLARMHAKVVGIDFSEKTIELAIETNNKIGLDAEFICCNLYDLPQHLNRQFDIVFTSYGTIGWLPDINKWAEIVSQFLKPNGEFVFVEFHPAMWMFDNDLKYVQYNYFKSDAIVEIEDGTYADKNAAMKSKSITWNHSLSCVIQSLLNKNLKLINFQEFDYSPYDVIANSIEISPSRFQSKEHGNKLPLVYSLKMQKV